MEREPKVLLAEDRAESLVEAEKFPEALKLYHWLCLKEPENIRHRMKLAEIIGRLGEADKAKEILEEAARQSALSGRVLRTVAVCKLGLALFPDHRKVFEGLLTKLHRRAVLLDRPPTSPPRDDTTELEPDSQGTVPDSPPESPLSLDELSDLMDEAYQAAMRYPADGGAFDDADDLELSAMPFFSDLSAADFVAVVEGMEVLDADEGTEIIKQGDSGDSFYLLVRGRVVVERLKDDGEKVKLAELSDASLFGEMALLSRSPRIATVRAMTKCELFKVPRSVLDRLVEERPNIAGTLVEFTKKRLLANLLTTSPLFTKFSRKDRQEIIDLFDKVLVDDGEVIFEEGSNPGALYLVSTGEVTVTKKDEDGETLQLAVLGPGDVFGEISLLRGQPANATVTATARSVLLKLERKRFFNMAMQYPPVLEYLENLTDERLAANEEILSDEWVYGADDLVMV